MEVKDGSFAITEQGDLGLGLTPIDESVLKEREKGEKDKNESDKLFK